MNKGFKFALLGLVLIALLFIPNNDAAAFPDYPGCRGVGGRWVDVSPTVGICVFSTTSAFAEGICGPGVGMIDVWSYNPKTGSQNLVESKCTTDTSHLPVAYDTVVSGEPLDSWLGKCGVYVFSPPYRGSIQILSLPPRAVPRPAPNYTSVCDVAYFHEDGNEATRWGSAAWMYMNLDSTSAKYWNDGDLKFYVLTGETWGECANPLFVEFGEHGRLACYSNNPSMWGIGTALKMP